jgi:hypothetical protein
MIDIRANFRQSRRVCPYRTIDVRAIFKQSLYIQLYSGGGFDFCIITQEQRDAQNEINRGSRPAQSRYSEEYSTVQAPAADHQVGTP